ncbi:hypothetical protein, partial [uncultured Sutterella sp.]|uniref:hypothetical protein n=1 Tax=uncultured Sutterella sp. TaxID=286133 RepID=UPI00280B9ABA
GTVGEVEKLAFRIYGSPLMRGKEAAKGEGEIQNIFHPEERRCSSSSSMKKAFFCFSNNLKKSANPDNGIHFPGCGSPPAGGSSAKKEAAPEIRFSRKRSASAGRTLHFRH